jgi:hypothetical protein
MALFNVDLFEEPESTDDPDIEIDDTEDWSFNDFPEFAEEE